MKDELIMEALSDRMKAIAEEARDCVTVDEVLHLMCEAGDLRDVAVMIAQGDVLWNDYDTTIGSLTHYLLRLLEGGR